MSGCRLTGVAGITVGAILAGAGMVHAEDVAASDGAATSASAPATAPAAAAPTPSKPLMAALDSIGLGKPMEDANINLYGCVESSYNYNLTSPKGDPNEGRSFDQYKNQGIFDQTDLTLERTVDVSKKQWDVGFRVETLWGSDASLVHSNGLLDWYDSPTDPQNQWDINQAYVDLAIPVGNGLRVRAGKYVTPLGAETINPNTVPFFSRSYLFNYAIPFTQTGVIATYSVDDNWTVEGGAFRGWEQSTDDNNGSPSGEAKVAYVTTDKKLSIVNNIVSGPEQADNQSDYRTVWDLLVCYIPDPKGPWTFMVNTDYGYEANVPGIGDSQWYGVAAYTGYALNNRYTLNGRVEWFRDNDGSRIGVIGDFYEATLGVTIKPFPTSAMGSGLLVRPEIRWDHSDDAFFGQGHDHDQATLAVDVIFNF
jgi:hypothetical protein